LLSQVAALVTTVYLHRGMTHRGIRFTKGTDFAFRLLLWLSTGQPAKRWISVHRKHHRFTDREGDPHSPYLAGFWSIQLFNYKHFLNAVKDKAMIEHYAPDIREDWFDRHVFRYGDLGLVASGLFLAIPLGWWALLAAVINLFVIMIGSATINGLCHWMGPKNFDNTAGNIQWVAWWTGGEGLHNNHHAFPSCPKLSMRRREWDPAWLLIRTLAACRLCTPAKTVSLDEPVLHQTVAERLAHKPVLVKVHA
jgi:stearoyl-CoA desaturase (delta-9 desaturase)